MELRSLNTERKPCASCGLLENFLVSEKVRSNSTCLLKGPENAVNGDISKLSDRLADNPQYTNETRLMGEAQPNNQQIQREELNLCMLLWIILQKEAVTIAAHGFRSLEGVSHPQEGLSNQIRLVIDLH